MHYMTTLYLTFQQCYGSKVSSFVAEKNVSIVEKSEPALLLTASFNNWY